MYIVCILLLFVLLFVHTEFWCTLSVYWQNKIFESLVNTHTHTEYLHIMLAGH